MASPIVNSLLKEIEDLIYNHEEKINVNLILAKMYYVLVLITDND